MLLYIILFHNKYIFIINKLKNFHNYQFYFIIKIFILSFKFHIGICETNLNL